MAMHTTCVRVQEDTMDKIKEIATKKRRSVTQMMRIILEDYVEKVDL